jgi:hypothetical protein
MQVDAFQLMIQPSPSSLHTSQTVRNKRKFTVTLAQQRPQSSYNHVDKTSTTTALFGLLGDIFGSGTGTSSKTDKDAVLAEYNIDVQSSSSSSLSLDVQYDSLVDYITNEWTGLFNSGTITLTTPVQVVRPVDGAAGRSNSSSVKFVFRKSTSNYKKWEDDNDDGNDNKQKQKDKDNKKQDDEVSEGAVMVSVEKIGSSILRVRAIRADIDDDTIIKEMSEEKIIQELQVAVDVWKKQQNKID